MPQISYTLEFPNPHTHLYHVTVDVVGLANEQVDFVLPVWTPGAYVVSDFARHVQDFGAGKMSWRKVDKSRWRVVTGGAGRVRVTYKVWAFELEVDKSHLDGTHAYFNGASLFMYVDGWKERPVTLDIKAPRGWKVTTGLEGGPTSFRATNYDELVDCPTEVGTDPVKKFRVMGKEHRVLIHGVNNWGLDRVAKDCEKLVKAEARLFGSLPYKHYTFLFYAVTGHALGGLEHRNSTAITLGPWLGRPAKDYERVLEVTSHEFFHTWNVKRIHPKVLGPFNYEKEVYTKLLWVMEGITSYYDDLMCARSKVYDAKRYLKKMAEAIQRYREKPSRLRQSLTDSSFDTWLWRYKGDGNINNRMMSYYEKGALVGLCLDLEIRRRTKNRVSLDDVMRTLWKEYASKERYLDEDEFQPIVERVAGGSYDAFFRKYVDGTSEVPFEDYVKVAGLELKKEKVKTEGDVEPDLLPWIGVGSRPGAERPIVTTITEGSPAFDQGIYPDDELVAVNDVKVDNGNFTTVMREHKPAQKVKLTVFRGARLLDVPLTLGKRENINFSLALRKNAPALEKAVYESWLEATWPKEKKEKKGKK